MKALMVAGLAVAGLAGLIIAFYSQPSERGGDSGEETISAFYATPEHLIGDSTLRVLGEFIGEQLMRAKAKSSVVEHTGIFNEAVIRTFRVVEVIKGDAKAGQELRVGFSRGFEDTNLPQRSQVETVRAIEKGKIYALFLVPYGGTWPIPIMVETGEPGIAELVGTSLSFRASDKYKDALTRNRFSSVPGSDAPFSLTLVELRALALTAEPYLRDPANWPDSPAAAPVKPTSEPTTFSTPPGQAPGIRTPVANPTPTPPAGRTP